MSQYSSIGDTAMWRLNVYISAASIDAWLKNLNAPGEAPKHLLHADWDPKDTDGLGKIEAAVFDNPSVLDDFECDIVIETPKYLPVPPCAVENDEGDSFAANLLNVAYPAEPDDVMADNVADADVDVVYTLQRGLFPFLNRTFPGARISSHVSRLLRYIMDSNVDSGELIYADIREGWVDIVALKNRRLHAMVSQEWHSSEDAAYHILNVASVHGFNLEGMEVRLAGKPDSRKQIEPMLTRFCKFVASDNLPPLPDFDSLPLGAALCTTRGLTSIKK